MSLEHRVAIVTGGGQGIGQQIALCLAREGARVVIADINTEGSRETAEMIRATCGAEAIVMPTDITSGEQVKVLVGGTWNIDHRIDILVNNAGITGPIKNIEDIAVEEWEETMAVNLRGMFLCSKQVVPVMKKQGRGNIINIASVTGKRPLPQRTPYATTKMGVIGFTRTLAAELGKWKIRVNAVCPGAVVGTRQIRIYEGMMKHTGKSFDEVAAERKEASALKAFVDPKYIGAMVVFLCSEGAEMITGQDINVCAGTIMY